MEFEPYFGASLPQYVGGSKHYPKGGLDLGFELRYNIRAVPISVGLETNIVSAVRGQKPSGESSRRNVSLSLTSDWYFSRSAAINPFIGVGLGYAKLDTIVSTDDYEGLNPTFGKRFGVTPRIGVELWNHLRITIDARFFHRDYNTVALRLGYSFGGSYHTSDR